MNKESFLNIFIGLILLAGVVSLSTLVYNNSSVFASISGPISSPVSPTPTARPSATPISAPVSPSIAPTPTPYPSVSPSVKPSVSPSPTPYPYLVCKGDNQTVYVNQKAYFSVTPYSPIFSRIYWSAPFGNPSSGFGSNFSTSFSKAGDYKIAVYSKGPITYCRVTVLPALPITIYKVEFFNNIFLKGNSVLTTFTTAINYNWGLNAPYKQVKKDNFSARFVGKKYFEGGRYTVTTSNDDGIRFYLDGNLVHNAWYNQGAIERSFNMDIPAGYHSVKVEYYDKSGLASVKLDFKKI